MVFPSMPKGGDYGVPINAKGEDYWTICGVWVAMLVLKLISTRVGMMIRYSGGIPWFLEFFVKHHYSSKITGKAIK